MRHDRFELPVPRTPAAATAPEVAQSADGRWRWDDQGIAAAAGFRSRDEALADRALRHAAPQEASGRAVLPKEHLRKLISAAAQSCAACADVYFGGVYWHPRDAGGCNWSVGIMGGSGDHAACLAGLLVVKDELRRRYAIADEA